MKVDVLQVEQATFHSRFHFWSNWVDVAVYDYVKCYLLQMSVSRFNKKKFRSVTIPNHDVKSGQIGDLTNMSQLNKVDR